MSNCINYECDDELGVHNPNECGEELNSGISGTLLLECNHQITDPSSASQIAAEIASGRATLLDGVMIGIDEPSPMMQTSNIVGGTEKPTNYNRSGTMIDANVNANNIDLYNKLLGGKVMGGAIQYLKGTEESSQGAQVLFIDASLTFSGGLPIKNNSDETMRFNTKFTWRKKTMPLFYPAPVGIFG